jgi:hypothetical protein
MACARESGQVADIADTPRDEDEDEHVQCESCVENKSI